ncbi:MAG: hypothetical protein IPK61_04225 [Saprospiraceae bacterium]|nr:hypothetical protein [Saprospiraceae bacterium]
MQFGNGAAYHYEENNWQFGAGTWGDVIVNNPGTNNIRDNGAGDLQLSVGPKIADMVSWNYGCSSCRSVDQYGVGLQNTWNGNSYTLTIPNSSNVVSVILTGTATLTVPTSCKPIYLMLLYLGMIAPEVEPQVNQLINFSILEDLPQAHVTIFL